MDCLKTRLSAKLTLGTVAFALTAGLVHSAPLAWDPGQVRGGTSTAPLGSGGSGIWAPDQSVALWSNGTGNTSWGSGSQASTTAIFGGTAGTVTVQATGPTGVTAAGIQFTTSGYLLTRGPSGSIAAPAPSGSQDSTATTLTIDTGAGFTNQLDVPLIGAGSVVLGTIKAQGAGTLIIGGTGVDNSQARMIVDAGTTVVLAKVSSNVNVHALGVAAGSTQAALTVLPGATARLGGSGGDQIRDRARISISGTLDMNGRSEATSLATFNGATLNFTIGDALGLNDRLSISNGGANEFTSNFGAATVLGNNIINISARDGITTLTPGNYTLIAAASGLGTSAWTLGSNSILVGGVSYDLSLANSTSAAQVLTVAVSVPEPGAISCVAAGAMGLLTRRRRFVAKSV